MRSGLQTRIGGVILIGRQYMTMGIENIACRDRTAGGNMEVRDGVLGEPTI